jgi:hypothetical protein
LPKGFPSSHIRVGDMSNTSHATSSHVWEEGETVTARNLFCHREVTCTPNIERRHARSQMKRALETLHGASSGSDVSSSDDDNASPRRVVRSERTTGPRRHSAGACQLVDEALSTRRNSIRLDRFAAPSAAYFESPDTPAGDRRCPFQISPNTPTERPSTTLRGDSLMKISRGISESMTASNLLDSESSRMSDLSHQSDATSVTSAVTAADWSELLQRCNTARVLLSLDQHVPKELIDCASSLVHIDEVGMTSSFSIYLSSCSTSGDNSQSSASLVSHEDCDAQLQGALDALLCTP